LAFQQNRCRNLAKLIKKTNDTMSKKSKNKIAENLYLRGKTYYCRVQVRGRDVRVSLRTGNIGQARKERGRLLREVLAIRSAPRKEDHAETWDRAVVAHCDNVLDKQVVAPSTAERYRDSFRKVGPLLHGKPLTTIGARVIAGLVIARQEMDVSNATVKRDLTAISRVMDYAISRGVKGVINTAKAYPRSFLHETQVVIRPPTDAEIALVIEMVAAERIKQWPVLASWLRATGMRIGETLLAQRAWLTAVDDEKPAC